MEKINLTASVRDITGKKVKKLRSQGMLPINVFGKSIKSKSLTVPVKDFLTIYKKAGETGLIELKAEKETFHTLVSHVQFHPLTRLPLHAQLHAVSLTEKIKANVPVEFVGESPAVRDQVGILLQTLNEVEVEALPTNLPEKISVDVTNLSAVDQQIVVGEIKPIDGVEILTDKDEIVVKVAPAVSQEVQKEAEEAAAKAAAETASATETATATSTTDSAPTADQSAAS